MDHQQERTVTPKKREINEITPMMTTILRRYLLDSRHSRYNTVVSMNTRDVVVVQSLSHVWHFCNPMTRSPPGSSVHGISQARILEWVAISFSRASSWPMDWTSLGRQILYHCAASEAHKRHYLKWAEVAEICKAERRTLCMQTCSFRNLLESLTGYKSVPI